MQFLSKTTLCDNDIELNEIQQLSANSLLGNPTGSTANVGIITLANGVTFDGTTLKVKTNEGLTSSGLDLSVDGLRIKLGGGITGSGLNVSVNGLELSINSDYFTIQSNQLTFTELGANTLFGNPTISADAPTEITLGAGLEFDAGTLKVTNSIPQPTGTCQFWGVIPPATDTTIFLDNVTNSRLNTPIDVLRVLHFKYRLYKDSTDELLHDNFANVQIEKINRNGTINKSSISGAPLVANNLLWNETVHLNFFPRFNFNTTTGDLDLFINYTNGANGYTYDVRLVVDVEYYDYPI